MIIDSHCHAWRSWPYQPAVPDPESRGAVGQLIYEMRQNGVAKAALVCARIGGNADNNAYAASAASTSGGLLIPLYDIDSCWSPEYHTSGAIERLVKAAGALPAAGFTHYLGPEPDEWLTSEEGAEFFAFASEHDLVASLAAGPKWYSRLRRLAVRTPRLKILLHHLGGVRANSADLDRVLAEFTDFAGLPNIFVKASGFYYGVDDPWDFPFRESIAVFERIVDAFGPGRVCWGSDYPVCLKGRATYRQALEVVRTHCSSFISPEHMEGVLGENFMSLVGHAAGRSGIEAPA